MKNERGQAVVVLALLAFGVVAFIMIYLANSGNNARVANELGETISNALEPAPSVIWQEYNDFAEEAQGNVYMVSDHASRHSKTVADIHLKCNEGTSTAQAIMTNPTTNRKGYICFIDGFWVITIKNFDPAKVAEWGDDVVTAFPRRMAESLQDCIDYMIKSGYQL